MKIVHSWPVRDFNDLPMSAPLGRVHRVTSEDQDYIRTAITAERVTSFGKYGAGANPANVPDTPANSLTDIITGQRGLYVENGVLKDANGDPVIPEGGITSAIAAVVSDPIARTNLSVEDLYPNALVIEKDDYHFAIWRFLGGEGVPPSAYSSWRPVGEIIWFLPDDVEISEDTVLDYIPGGGSALWSVPSIEQGETWSYVANLLVDPASGAYHYDMTGGTANVAVVMSGLNSAYSLASSPVMPSGSLFGGSYDFFNGGAGIVNQIGSSQVVPVTFWGYAEMPLSESSLSFRHCQDTSDIVPTKLLKGSTIRLTCNKT